MRKFWAPAPKLLPPPDRAPPPYFRAPEGARSPPVTHTAAAMTPRAWSVGTLYWTKPGVPTILAYVRCELSPRRRHPDARRRRAPRAEHRRAAGTAARTHRLARMHRRGSPMIIRRPGAAPGFQVSDMAALGLPVCRLLRGSWNDGVGNLLVSPGAGGQRWRPAQWRTRWPKASGSVVAGAAGGRCAPAGPGW